MIFRKFLILFVMLLLVGCGGSSGDNESDADALIATLLECRLVTDGDITDNNLFGNDCEESCIAQLSCEDLESGVCGQGSPAFLGCFETCSPQDFICGDQTLIPGDFECDAEEDCSDGSDEANCPVFTCDDGEQILAPFECDIFVDCLDESDEANCSDADFFTCTDGDLIPADFQCDFEEDCFDGSDEAGCAELICSEEFVFTCDDGEQIPASFECDFEEDCVDLSDEAKCP